MGAEKWYRGEVESGAASTPGGGAIHDLGDGVYYTSDREVAKKYTDGRAKANPTQSRAYVAYIDTSRMRVLDLTQDARWNNFLRSKPSGVLTVDQMIKRANENYGRFFKIFVDQHKINLKRYDAIIGPEYVRGGKQLCVLLKNGQQTPLHAQIRATEQLYYKAGKETSVSSSDKRFSPPPSSLKILRPNSAIRRAAANQGAAAMIGVALGGLTLWLGDKGIERRIRKEIETTHAATINSIVARGHGILFTIRLSEWVHPNDLGMRAKNFLSVEIQSGATLQSAWNVWSSQMRYLSGPPSGWRVVTKYVWQPSAN